MTVLDLRHATLDFIEGRWTPSISDHLIDVVNPADGHVIAHIPEGSAADVDAAVHSARQAFAVWSTTTPTQRQDVLRRIEAIYARRSGDLGEAILREIGAPRSLAYGLQVDAGRGHLLNTIGYLDDFEFEKAHGTTRIIREAIGVVGLITPWNWPLHQILSKLAGALATGCTVVLKPSELAPLNATILTEVLDEAGVPAGVFNLVQGRGDIVGARMAAHPDIDLISITGSTQSGVAVAQLAAPTVKRVVQELGGKSPNIILDDADLDIVIPEAVARCFINSGQSCNAATRLLVPRSLQERVIEIAARSASEYVTGHPDHEATTLGPLISRLQFDRVQRLIAEGIGAGAQLVAGGIGRPEGTPNGWFVRPTVFAGVDSSMSIAREEIFGPVLSIVPFDDDDEAVAIANDTEFGLAAYVSSADIGRARMIAGRLRAGQVTINGAAPDITAPFGGYKRSGNGRELGEIGLHDFLEVKAVIGYE
jgi:aldehyde dehydrogenase (NAD+)